MYGSSNSRRTRRLGLARPASSGYSPSAGKVIVVIAYRDLNGDLHGMNAWPASGRDLATYLKEGDDGEEP
jgi:hypothetical protein